MTHQPDQLGILINRAASGRLLTEHEGAALREAVAKLQADEAQARRTAGALMAQVQKLGGQLKTAEAQRDHAQQTISLIRRLCDRMIAWFNHGADDYQIGHYHAAGRVLRLLDRADRKATRR